MYTKELVNKIQLSSNSLTSSDAINQLIKSIDDQINDHKLKNLSNWVHDHNCDQKYHYKKIKKLEKLKRKLFAIKEEAQATGLGIKMPDSLNLALKAQESN